MPPFTIHRAQPDDAERLAVLGARLFRQAYGPTHPEPELSAYLERSFSAAQLRTAMSDRAAVLLLVESLSGEAIGYAHLEPTPSGHAQPKLDGPTIEIQRFYVEEAWHGRGVAAPLMEASVSVARDLGASMLWLQAWQQALRALAFYVKMGFVITGTTTFRFGERIDDDHILSRRL